jgi:chlorite dismutase
VSDRGQYVAYTIFKVRPEWRRLPIEERDAGKEAFAETVEEFTPRFEHLRAYTCTGVRPDVDFFLWKITESSQPR